MHFFHYFYVRLPISILDYYKQKNSNTHYQAGITKQNQSQFGIYFVCIRKTHPSL